MPACDTMVLWKNIQPVTTEIKHCYVSMQGVNTDSVPASPLIDLTPKNGYNFLFKNDFAIEAVVFVWAINFDKLPTPQQNETCATNH